MSKSNHLIEKKEGHEPDRLFRLHSANCMRHRKSGHTTRVYGGTGIRQGGRERTRIWAIATALPTTTKGKPCGGLRQAPAKYSRLNFGSRCCTNPMFVHLNSTNVFRTDTPNNRAQTNQIYTKVLIYSASLRENAPDPPCGGTSSDMHEQSELFCA